jgi:hypothetical protein
VPTATPTRTPIPVVSPTVGPTLTPVGPTLTPVGSGALSGRVVNAVTNQPIGGAIVTLPSTGQTITADSNGQFLFSGLPAGSVQVTASAPGFAPSTQTGAVPAGGTGTIVLALSPTLAPGQYRIVLTWGASPSDLDSHLWVPTTPSPTEVYFGNLGSLTSPPFAQLDQDDTTGFGPETITIAQVLPGQYTYAVHNFSGAPPITTSAAQVTVFDSNGQLASFNVPTTGTGTWWTVFTFNNGTVTPVNTISTTPPLPSGVGGQTGVAGAAPPKPPRPR